MPYSPVHASVCYWAYETRICLCKKKILAKTSTGQDLDRTCQHCSFNANLILHWLNKRNSEIINSIGGTFTNDFRFLRSFYVSSVFINFCFAMPLFYCPFNFLHCFHFDGVIFSVHAFRITFDVCAEFRSSLLPLCLANYCQLQFYVLMKIFALHSE